LETLPGAMPDELRQLGYDAINTGEGERLLPNAIDQKLTLTSSGAYELLTQGSTKAIAMTKTFASVTTVRRYSFTMERQRQAMSGLRGKAEVAPGGTQGRELRSCSPRGEQRC
jgi:hypothetical protein